HALWLDERAEQDVPGAFEEPAKARLSDLSEYVLRQREPEDESARQVRMAPSDLLMRWLWDVLVGPLVEHLAVRDFQQAVLNPTGLLDRLPLHAAWTEDPAAPTGRRYALDGIAFSYAPSARALAAAQPVTATIAPDAILAIDNPDGSLHFCY